MKVENPRAYYLTKELISLTEEMQCAMMRASTEYVRHGQLTPAMRDILMRFFMWAGEAEKEGL